MTNLRIASGIEIVSGETYGALRLIPSVVGQPIDPILRMDVFTFNAPTFEEHPHAGYSTLSYIFPDSLGHIRCTSQEHDPTDVLPGSLFWTAAGRGTVHTEHPDTKAGLCNGIQIYVKQSCEDEVNTPRHKLVVKNETLKIEMKDADCTLLFGSYKGQHVGIFGLSYALLAVKTKPVHETHIPIPKGWSVMGFMLLGEATINKSKWPEDHFVSAIGVDFINIQSAESAEFLLFIGLPNQEPLYWEGPFAMTSTERLDLVKRSYKLGFMNRK